MQRTATVQVEQEEAEQECRIEVRQPEKEQRFDIPVEVREKRRLADIVGSLFCRTVDISPDRSTDYDISRQQYCPEDGYQPEA